MRESRSLPGVPIFAGIVLGAAIISLALLHNRGEINADAALGFFGSVIGTAGAVLGALYVERSKQANAEKRDRQILEDSLIDLRATLDALGQEPVGQGTPKESFENELGLLDQTRHSLMETDAVLQAADYGRRFGDAKLIVKLHRVQRVIAYRLPLLKAELEKGAPKGARLESRAVDLLTATQEAQESLIPHIDDALANLRKPRPPTLILSGKAF